MAEIDKRFALIRNGQPWYAVRIQERGKAIAPTYRISIRGKSRDAYDQSEKLTDIKSVAQKVLCEGKRMRCAQEGGPASSLDIKSQGVQKYRLDPHIAKDLGVPSEGDTSELVLITPISEVKTRV
ncbi:hypothetical protein [Advenella alkanexedens]|uniref:hypothetical protein n=1 Tax=Advenella alkanexedens TaxID=1481665 RepID=UPI0026761FD0|nr:hypothetical protein [Advenella alkanexedens]WKU19018.1 hypothetical protein Q3V95_12075 [Advenella alkanexedens]